MPDTARGGERAKALDSLQRRLETLVEVWEGILKGPAAAIGKPFSLHGQDWTIEGFAGSGLGTLIVLRPQGDASGRPPLRQPVWRLPGPQLATLAEWATERQREGEAAVKVASLCLTEGEGRAPSRSSSKPRRRARTLGRGSTRWRPRGWSPRR